MMTSLKIVFCLLLLVIFGGALLGCPPQDAKHPSAKASS